MNAPHTHSPRFELQAPALNHWRAGNTGIEGVWRFEASEPGRDVLVTALVHGNELCGAWALLEALEAGIRPRRGALTLAFCNLAAFDRFDPLDTDRSRFVDQDFNRLWGAMPWRRHATELNREQQRVLELQPVVERADWLLDLHSMHAQGPPLGLTGLMAHHAAHAASWGAPGILVADAGHAAGTRMRDHGRFGHARDEQAVALLVECGWHGDLSSRTVALDMLHRFLHASGCLDHTDLPARWRSPDAPSAPQQLLVTHAITVQPGQAPQFHQDYRTGQVIEHCGTVIGHDGAQAVVTPYDGCVLVMPSLAHATPGATMVRLARRV
ncbi:MAG: succinylglutamate desuccinylase [Betaproteobacteria bacterium]|nr:succinylglutamate desuccinylase [Betaproteobacteria bacterium]